MKFLSIEIVKDNDDVGGNHKGSKWSLFGRCFCGDFEKRAGMGIFERAGVVAVTLEAFLVGRGVGVQNANGTWC